jgi:hypothetical protein
MLQALDSVPGHKKIVKNGGRESFESEMSHSQFCIAAQGDMPTTEALMSALKHGCMPIVLSDDARFPFEGVFIDYDRIIAQVRMKMDRLEDLGAKMSLLNERVSARARDEMKYIGGLLTEKGTKMNEQKWGWAWMQYIQAVIVKTATRRGNLKRFAKILGDD